MTTTCKCSAVGLAQIAEHLGVKRKTANMWKTRDLLPEPQWRVGKDPAWCWPHQIQPWARKTRRLDEDSAHA